VSLRSLHQVLISVSPVFAVLLTDVAIIMTVHVCERVTNSMRFSLHHAGIDRREKMEKSIHDAMLDGQKCLVSQNSVA